LRLKEEKYNKNTSNYINCSGKNENTKTCHKKNDDYKAIESEKTLILSAVNLEKIYQSAQKFVKSYQISIKMTLSRQSKKWILIGVVILGLCYLVLHSSGKKR